MKEPTKLSPIHAAAEQSAAQFSVVSGWRVPTRFTDGESELAAATRTVAMADRSDLGKIRVEGESAARMLGVEPVAVHEGKRLQFGESYCLRRDLFFVNVEPDDTEDALKQLMALARTTPGLLTITDVTHGNAQLQIVGPRSALLLSHICGLDFGPDSFPNQTARQSSVAKTAQIIIRRDVGSVPAYYLVGARSLGRYLWETIIKAGEKLGIEPVGVETIRRLNA